MSLMLALVLIAADGSSAEAYWPSTALSFQDPTIPAPPPAEEPPKKMWLGYAWEGGITAGMTYTRGNTNTSSAAVDGKAVGRGENDRLTFGAFYLAGRQEDPATGVESTSARRYGGSAKYDYFMRKEWYAYAVTSAEKDAIRTLDLLFNAGVGTGYQWVESEQRNLFTEAGVGYTDEDYEDDSADSSYISARVALHYDEKIGKNATFFHDSQWMPSLEDFNEDQIVKTVTGIRAGITGSLSLEAKVLFDWDSSPAPGQDSQDVTYIVGVTWTF